MVPFRLITAILVLAISSTAFAVKVLMPPSGQTVQCGQSYQLAEKPPSVDNIFNSLKGTCFNAGGDMLLHNFVGSEVIFTCTGSTPDNKIFICQFSISPGNL